MKFEMATLYSRFTGRRAEVAFTFGTPGAERSRPVKAMFYDVLGHFHRAGVAKRRQSLIGPMVMAIALAAGCAGVGGLRADTPAEVKREAVAARAQARW